MGGNAFHNFPVGRLNKKEFMECFEHVNSVLGGNVKLDLVPAYAEKVDFGDLDLILEKESSERFFNIDDWAQTLDNKEKHDKFKQLFIDNFHTREFRFAFPVISFDYRFNKDDEIGFQVDLIHVPEQFYDFSLKYFSYNDLGNLLGVMFRNMGLKFGHYGLNYELYTTETNKFGEFLITDNFDEALSFLKLDVNRFYKGFNNLNEIFDYVTSTPYFSKKIYALEEGVSSYKSRRRNAQRGTYNSFLNWIEETDKILPEYPHTTDKMERLSVIQKTFGEKLIKSIENTRNIALEKIKNKKKVEGEKISEWTGLTNKALGYLMTNFRNQFKNKEDYDSWLKENNEDDIKNKILEFKKTLDFTGLLGDPKTNPKEQMLKRKLRG